MEQLPHKRKRSEASNSDSEVSIELIRGDPWFDDGNIVLEVERTQFKVYGGLLSKKSDIFTDMLRVPQPSEGQETLDGCPLVRLSDDSAKDWHYCLKALFERSYISIDTNQFTLDVVAAFLRLGKKYNFDDLVAEASQKLIGEIPLTLSECDCHVPSMFPTISDLFEVVNLARKHDLPRILPLALQKIVVTCSPNRLHFIAIGDTNQNGRFSILSATDQALCYSAYRDLCRLQMDTTFSWLKPSFGSATCVRPSSCSISKENLRQKYFEIGVLPPCLPLAKWNDGWNKNLCNSCCLQAQVAHYQGRKDAWNKLPDIFGLPPWEELLASEPAQPAS